MSEELMRVRGIGPIIAEKLIKAGIDSIEKLATCKSEDIMWIKGFGDASAKKVIQSAKDTLNLEAGLQKVLDSIKENFVRNCPKCGGEMDSKFVILGPQRRQSVYQCKLCKFYLPR